MKISVELMSGNVFTLEAHPEMIIREFKETLKAGFWMKHENPSCRTVQPKGLIPLDVFGDSDPFQEH